MRSTQGYDPSQFRPNRSKTPVRNTSRKNQLFQFKPKSVLKPGMVYCMNDSQCNSQSKCIIKYRGQRGDTRGFGELDGICVPKKKLELDNTFIFMNYLNNIIFEFLFDFIKRHGPKISINFDDIIYYFINQLNIPTVPGKIDYNLQKKKKNLNHYKADWDKHKEFKNNFITFFKTKINTIEHIDNSQKRNKKYNNYAKTHKPIHINIVPIQQHGSNTIHPFDSIVNSKFNINNSGIYEIYILFFMNINDWVSKLKVLKI